ncbi:MAG: DUF547 domain-containing protein [Syntrophobacteraceae bacterium]
MKDGKISKYFIIAVCLLILVSSASGWCSQQVDNSIYAGLLKKFVKNGVVDYAGLKKNEAEVDKYVTLLKQTNPQNLSRNERLAFYINTYNINAMKIVIGGYPGIHSIKDMGSIFRSVWTKKVFKIGGHSASLDDIENRVRGFHDPRVHFALNCASKSCPPLRSQPYEGDMLNQQLDSAARAFINNPHSNYLKGNTLYLSKIFDWYAGDFEKWYLANKGGTASAARVGGDSDGGVLAFFMRYAKPDLKKKLEERASRIEIEYLPYDWSLDGK